MRGEISTCDNEEEEVKRRRRRRREEKRRERTRHLGDIQYHARHCLCE